MKSRAALEDQELVTLLKQGDRAAYSQIFDRYSGLLVSHAYRMLGDRDEANDVVQDIFMALWQKGKELELNVSLSSYLYGSVRNRVLNRMSHDKVVARYVESIMTYMNKGETLVEDLILAKELEKLIEIEIAALPERMREIFILHRKEELSYKEIADKLGITDHTARQQVYNATKILRSKIRLFISVFFA